MALQGNPRFAPASFKGQKKLNGIMEFIHQLVYTNSGYIGDLTAYTAATGSKILPFGHLVSVMPGEETILLPGIPAGSVPVGILMAEEGKMQNDPAMPEGYFETEQATIVMFGPMQFAKWAAGVTGLKGPSLGGKVVANNVTGEIGFVDFNDTAPAGFTALNAIVVRTRGPNGATILINPGPSLVVPGTGEDVTNTVATPVADPAAGAIPAGTAVSLSCATVGATIFYTLDGSTPDGDSIQYTKGSPIAVTAAVTIKAVALKEGMTNSAVLTAAYTMV